ncbi:hypothetical protein JCM10908_001784 [Rhodotorula pacifica]|uniref:uncharacterized protein n=1 Tax=Rhodotorula pacifica TaxID=1495444 RepID=UPI00316E28A6
MPTHGLVRQQPPLWSLPVSQRPSLSVRSLLVSLPLTLAFIALFDLGILATFIFLVLAYPLYFLSRWTRRAYRQAGKRAFGRLLVVIVRWFSPTDFVLSAGHGIDEERWIERDEDGKLVSLRLPDKALWISNHTTLTDWIYLWILAYLSAGHSASLYISLKSSLRRIPIIGSAAHLFGFIFMARKWATDKEPFKRQLEEIARENEGEGKQMALLLFPEGTIVTENTRGISRRFADKTQVDDFKHLLLPRSTGLYFALRQLARTTPSLKLVDITVGYPLPRSAPSTDSTPLYASDYYTLPSVLLSHVPPPELHIHIRTFALSEIPLGKLDETADDRNDEGTEAEKRVFEKWLQARWAEKDALMERFRTEGTFVADNIAHRANGRGKARPNRGTGIQRSDVSDDDDDDDDRQGEYRWPVSLRHPAWETFGAFQFGWTLLVAWLVWTRRYDLMTGILSPLVSMTGQPSAGMKVDL